MKGNKRVIDVLNESLCHELTAVNQYWLHYRMLDDWGFAKLAQKEREESIEEMQHADEIISRIIFLNGFPNMQQLNPLQIGEDIKEVLESDLVLEYNARTLYVSGRDICYEEGDYTSMALFGKLIEAEEGHIDFLETQLELLGKIGIQNYGMLQAEPSNAAE